MHTSMRPLVHSGISGSIGTHIAVGRSARRLFPAPSPCTSPSSCPQSAQLLNAHVELSRATASASSASDLAGDASTTAVLASRALERSFNGAVTATWSHEDHLAEHFSRPPASESDGPQPVASTSAPSDPDSAGRAHPKHRRRRGGRKAAAALTASGVGIPRPSTTDASGKQQDPDPGPVPAPPQPPQAVPRRALRPSRGPTSTAAAPSAPKPRAAGPPRPRLRPPPPPLSWPDYPYTRSPVASACSPHDTAGLKLEALFQCVLHYPRAPPRLLRFLRREVPDDVEARLAAITATVECLAGSVGREVAVYLIRRSAWLVLQPAEVLAPRMEAVRRLLRLQPGPGGGGVTDLLRKNPNLLRMQEDTVVGRYRALQKALYDAVGFDEQQLRALIIKYPLILNFKHESVHSALMALRRLCSARPDWTAFYKALSPSQVAFFVRERVVTLLRLEYLLLTGGGSGMTLRDIMKTSNNSFNRSYGGFRSWMQARLARLRQRMAQARAAMEARSRAEGREVSEEELGRLAAEVQAQYTQAEQERFHREFVHRREAERRDMERRMEQRQRAIEEKMQQQRSGLEREGEEEEEEDDGQQRRRWQWQQQSQRSPSGGGGGGGVASGAAHQAGRGARPAGRSVVPPAGTAFGSDPLDRVTLGRVWQRPGSRVPHSAGPGHGGSAQRQHRQ